MASRRALVATALALLVSGLLSATPAGAIRHDGPPQSTRDCDGLGGPSEGRGWDVGLVYIHQLERCPSVDELEYWTGRMDAGMTRLQLAESVDRSAESLAGLVDEIYERAEVKRELDAEATALTTSLRTTRDVVPATVAVLASDDFVAQHEIGGQPGAWIEAVYPLVFGRAAEEGVAAYWSGRDDLGTATGRTRALTSIMRSTEFRRAWITLVYVSILGRQPDAGSLAYWVGWIRGVGRHRTLLLRNMVLASAEAHGIATCPVTC